MFYIYLVELPFQFTCNNEILVVFMPVVLLCVIEDKQYI